jgi:hypothetical protein
MPHFVRARVLDGTLPAALGPVARKLTEFDSRCSQLRAAEPNQDHSEGLKALHGLHDELLALARQVLPPDTDPALVVGAEQAFAVAVLALHHYALTVDGDLEIIDTVGSKTLGAFRTDWQLGVLSESALREVLQSSFGFEPSSWAAIDKAMAVELADLDCRRRVIAALDQRYPLREVGAVHELFTVLYPGHPFRVGDVDIVRTATSLFFCLSFSGRRLVVADFEERSEEEKRAIGAFLQRLNEVKQEHFPVFGFFRAEEADPEVVGALAESLGLSRSVVTRTLTTMVSILRSQDIDKYLVHDAWGHQWQAHLFPFEEQYRASSRFRRLPPMHREVVGPGEWRGSLFEVFRGAAVLLASEAEVPTAHWDGYLRGVMVDRLLVAGVAAVAEMLADVSEFKIHVIGGEAAEHLSSSSFFPLWPTKLDLTLMDARVVFDTALEGFYRFGKADGRDAYLLQRLMAELPELGEERASVLIASLRGRVQYLLATEFKPEFWLHEGEKSLQINPFGRLCLNLLGVHTALNDVYQALAAEAREYPAPLLDFRDLLLMAIGGFYQQDPGLNFWHLDEFTALCFEPCMTRFCAALASRSAGGLSPGDGG